MAGEHDRRRRRSHRTSGGVGYTWTHRAGRIGRGQLPRARWRLPREITCVGRFAPDMVIDIAPGLQTPAMHLTFTLPIYNIFLYQQKCKKF